LPMGRKSKYVCGAFTVKQNDTLQSAEQPVNVRAMCNLCSLISFRTDSFRDHP
jgi:hypothetical protein